MHKLTQNKLNTVIEETKVLANKQIKNSQKIQKNIHILLDNSPGKNQKAREQFITNQFKEMGKSYSYLRRMIKTALLEKKLELEICTLNEYQARILYELKDQELRRQVYLRAKQLAGSKTMSARYINQAIEEIRPTKAKSGLLKKPKPRKNSSTNSENLDEESPDDNHEDAIDEEVTVMDIYEKICPFIKSEKDRALLINFLKAPNSFRQLCKKLSDYNMTKSEVDELIELIDPDGEYRPSPSSMHRKKKPSRGKSHIHKLGRKKTTK
jgi:hypothetical protein